MHYISIRRRILYITCIFTIIVGLVITIVSYIVFKRNSNRHLIISTENNLSYLADYIDSEMSSIDQLVAYCHSNSVITTYVESEINSVSKRMNAYDVLSEYCQNNVYSRYLHRVVITGKAKNFIQSVASDHSSVADIAHDLPLQDFYKDLLDNPMYYGYGFISDPFYKGHDNKVLPLLKPISYKFTDDIGGFMFLEISDRLFLDAIRKYNKNTNGTIILTLGDHDYLYEKDKFNEINSYTVKKEIPAETFFSTYSVKHLQDDNGQKYMAVTVPLNHKNCSVTHLIKEADATVGFGAFFPLLAFILAGLVVTTFILNNILNRTITRPVLAIQRRLSKISGGDFSRDTSIEWNHELGDIGKNVNDLAENIKQLLDSAVESEKQKRDLEYKVLQSQVNPHFLYNTLNSIKWMAITQGATGISEMTTALSRLLKSISKGTKLMIPLSDELSLLNDYFTIQQYRYGGTLQMNVNITDELKNYMILKFTLQPVVENAIFHGIEPTGKAGRIDIDFLKINDSDLEITVRDNGVGMTPELIEKVLNGEDSSSSEFFREFGIYNIQKRLNYEFGDPYGIRIESEPGEYTSMIITIPLILKDFEITEDI